MNITNYKGYLARIEYNDEDQCFIGHIAGIRDVVGFHGDSVKELKAAIRAEAEGKSLNAWAQGALQRAISAQ